MDKSTGPLLLLAELVQKKLIQHSWPCDLQTGIKINNPVWDGEDQTYTVLGCRFVPRKGRTIGSDFQEALETALRVVAHTSRARAYLEGTVIFLDGPHYVDKYGKIRVGVLPCPF